MAEVSQRQVLDLLYEVSDSFDRLDAKLDEVLVQVRILSYEMELGMKQIAEARSWYERVSSR